MKKKYKIIIIISLVILILAVIYNLTLAKFTTESIWNYFLNTKSFYFSSDYLDTLSINNVDNIWNGESIHFNLKNNASNEKVTEESINYNVTCTILGDAASYMSCNLNGTGQNTYSGILTTEYACHNNTGDSVEVSEYSNEQCIDEGYTWKLQPIDKDLYFELTSEEYEISNVTVQIEATSTSPYAKTITGTFSLSRYQNIGEITYEYNNYSNYGDLVITNQYNIDKCINVFWNPTNLLISNTENIYDNYTYDSNNLINSVDLSISANNSVVLIFYPTDFNDIFDKNEFLVTESTNCN